MIFWAMASTLRCDSRNAARGRRRISDDAHKQVSGQSCFACEDMGPQDPENIAEPVHVWRNAIWK